jgi:ABC-type polysaccharide/polyol phosphate transport system ATPase subunit
MSSREVIRVENLSKWYKLGVYSADTLVEEMKLWLKRKGNQLEQEHTGNSRVDERGNFWALRDINFR